MEKMNYSETNNIQAQAALLDDDNNADLDQDSQIVVRAPRKVVWEIILMVSTLSLYLPFWAVSRARDIKSATGKNYTPWLWFFTPLFWIAGVIAYQSMFKELQALEAKEQRDSWKFWTIPWFFTFIVLSIIINLQEKIYIPLAAFFLVLIAFCLLFAALHRRFNQWKNNDARLTFKGKRVAYTWYEWLVLVFSVPLSMYFFYVVGEKFLVTFNLPKYENQQEVVVQDVGFHFTIQGDKWIKVKPVDAAFKMIGPGDDTAVFVHSYDNGLSINDQASLRFSILEETYKDIKCTETQSFENGRSGVKSIMKCSATYWGDDVGLTSVISSLDGSLLEFVGVTTNTNSLLNEKISRQIYVMAESFHLIVGQENE